MALLMFSDGRLVDDRGEPTCRSKLENQAGPSCDPEALIRSRAHSGHQVGLAQAAPSVSAPDVRRLGWRQFASHVERPYP